MTLFNLFKAAFFAPRRLLQGKNTSYPKTFLYLLFLSLILTVPAALNVVKMMRQLQADFGQIDAKIPADTTITGGKLTTSQAEAGFIYQTNYLIFTFDPEGKTNATNLQGDLRGNLIGLGLLSDRLVLAYTRENLLASSLPASPVEVRYDDLQLNSLTPAELGSRSKSPTFRIIFSLLLLVLLLLPTAYYLMTTVLILSLIANLFNRFRGVTLTLGETFKTMSFAATAAVTLSALLQLLWPSIPANVIISLFTILTYYRITDIQAQPPRVG